MSEEVEVTGVVSKPKSNEYYICLENGNRIRVDKKEYQKMKRRLSGKSKICMDVEVIL